MSAVLRAIIAAAFLLNVAVASAQAPTPNLTASYGFVQPLEETLEWMVCDSRAIVHATIQPGPGDQIRFKVIEAIKGDLTSGRIVSVEEKPVFQQARFRPGQTVLL